jgi:hypothetical protein
MQDESPPVYTEILIHTDKESVMLMPHSPFQQILSQLPE